MASTATVYDTDCKLMLHFNGADGSTTFTDSSYSCKTITAYDNAQIDTAQYVFNGSSGLFDGNGDYLSAADSADFDLAAGDFTVDFWIRFAVVGTSQFVGQYNSVTNQIGWVIQYLHTTPALRFVYSTAGTAATQAIKTFAWTPSQDTWYHVAVVRSGNNLYAFIDGSQIGSTADVTGVTIFNSSALFEIAKVESTTLNMLNGWIDELRIVKGTAIWTSNFTKPSVGYTPASYSANYLKGRPRNRYDLTGVSLG